MKRQFNPWNDRFAGLLDRDVIRARATVKAEPILGVNALPLQEALGVVKSALEALHFVSSRELDLLEKLMGRAAAHCRYAYPDLATFSGHVNAEEIQLDLPEPICITGLAGSGKSSLLSALGRVMPADEVVELGSPFRTAFELNAYKRVVVKAKSTISQIMYPFLPNDARPRSKTGKDGVEILSQPKLSLDHMIELAGRTSYTAGRVTNFLDEFQFLTQSATANTKLAQVLMTVSCLNAPFGYAANFSLCHRLLKRPQEERDRLLGDIVVLMPEMPGSDGFNGLLREYQVVLGEVLGFNLESESNALHSRTVGIKRKLRQLLTLSYVEMRRSGKKSITMDHVSAAYKSNGFSVMREDVTTILEQAYSGKMLPGRADFWCPFGVEHNQIKSVLDSAKKAKSEAVVRSLVTSALTVSERRALAIAGQSANKSEATVIKMPPRQKQTLDASTLLQNTVQHKAAPVDGPLPRVGPLTGPDS